MTPEHGDGPPPCQLPSCEADAHFRTGYTVCLRHDPAEEFPLTHETAPCGIATDDFRYYFGASCGSSRKVLRQLEEPNVMLSYATQNNQPWDGIERLMVDSGGYSLLATGEAEYPDDVEAYLDYVADSGAAFYVTRDVPAAESVLENLDGGAGEAITRTARLTAETLAAARDLDIDAEPVAVLQGTTPEEYVECYHELVRRDAVTPRLAIGSLKGHSTSETVAIVRAVREATDADAMPGHDPVELHGLGVEVPALEYPEVQRALASADSSRYIRSASWASHKGDVPPKLRDDEPACAWYEVVRSYLEMRADLREALALPEAAARQAAVTDWGGNGGGVGDV